jgi:malonate transporter
MIGSFASSFVNANNIGIPVSVYVLGDAAYAAPVMLLQMLVFVPIVVAILDSTTGKKMSLKRVLTQPFRNPIIIGSALGVLLSVTDITLPAVVMEPLRLTGAAAVPVVLLSFGLSLHGQRLLQPGSGRRDVLLASAIKLVVMPVAAWLFGRFIFEIEGAELFAVVVLAALPTGQNVFNYAQRYERGVILARDTALLTTLGAVPILLLATALLH